MPEPIRKLAIVGASVRAAAFSALRAGYEVVAADLFADADLQRACPATRLKRYPDSLAPWLAATECDAWLYTGALENQAELIGRLSKMRPLLGNGAASLRASRSPMVLQPVLKDAGVGFPETVDSPQRLPLDGSWLCKTYRGASGAGVWLLDGAAALERARRENAVYQRFVSGVSAAAVFLCGAESSTVFGVTRQLVGDARAGARPWHYAGSIGPLAVSREVAAQLNVLGDVLSRRFQLRGLVGVDLVLAAGRAWVLEINPRISSSAEIVERVVNQSAVAAHVAVCRGEPLPAPGEPAAAFHGKAVLYAKQAVTITPDFHRWCLEQSSVQIELCQLADIPPAGQAIPAGQPILTVFAAASEQDIDVELGRRLAEVEGRMHQADDQGE
jgi:predicted ATP-grasp superfamily ATP-dependent carboligase